MTKYLDHLSCADCIHDPAFPSTNSTTTNNCNFVFGRQFSILLEHNNKATFHARTFSNCELIHFYSIDIKPVSLRTNAQHISAIIDNLLPFGFHWRMRENLTNYLLAKSGISDSLNICYQWNYWDITMLIHEENPYSYAWLVILLHIGSQHQYHDQ